MVPSNQPEISSEDMTIQDINSEYLGIPRYLLMENAGSQIASIIKGLKLKKNAKIAIFCGTGGNGGDGFVTARHLHDSFNIIVYLTGPASKIKSNPALKNYRALQLLRTIKIIEIKDSTEAENIPFNNYDLVVDGLLGTGLHSKVIKQPLQNIIEAINTNVSHEKPIIAIDIPSGLKKDGSPASSMIKATHTVALHQPKLGTYTYGGIVHVVPIGIPPESTLHTGPGLFSLYPTRYTTSHKGQNGKILIIGGSNEYHGSIILAGKAAFALNIDLVYMIAPEIIAPVLRNHDMRFIVKPYPESYLTPNVVDTLIKPMMAEVDTILVGPGLGTAPETLEAVKKILKAIPENKAVVIDADGLKAIKAEKLPHDTILTPHAGEFSLVTGKKLNFNDSIDTRVQEIHEAIENFDPNITWVVKGPVDVIAKKSQTLLNYTGTPAMTTGGTGDTLAGLITAIRSIVKDSYYASAMGTFLLGKAGELAETDNFTLESLLDSIPKVLKEIKKFIDEDESEILTKI